MNNSKAAVVVSRIISLIQLLSAIVILFFFGILTIIYITDSEWAAEIGVGSFIVFLVFDAIGILLIVLSRKRSRLIKEFRKYVTVISNDPNGFIPDIAAALGTSEDVVKSNIELMIKKKFFANAFIDKNSNCVVIGNRINMSGNVQVASQNAGFIENTKISSSAVKMQVPEMITVKCKGCGGINTLLKGQVGECDYCGSAIRGE